MPITRSARRKEKPMEGYKITQILTTDGDIMAVGLRPPAFHTQGTGERVITEIAPIAGSLIMMLRVRLSNGGVIDIPGAQIRSMYWSEGE
jgi:hypothetical protein